MHPCAIPLRTARVEVDVKFGEAFAFTIDQFLCLHTFVPNRKIEILNSHAVEALGEKEGSFENLFRRKVRAQSFFIEIIFF